MLTNAALIWFARVAAVAGLTAAGAGGIYLVAPTIDRDGETGERQVAEQSPPPAETQTAPAVTPPDGATPTASVTPIPGLTDTGYETLYGTPLYEECIAQGAPLPPAYPEPVTVTPAPALPPTERLTTPPADYIAPSFDWLGLSPVDTSGWAQVAGRCFGFTVRIPPTLRVEEGPVPSGYAYGEYVSTEKVAASGPRASLRFEFTYSPVDVFAREASATTRNDNFVLAYGDPITIDGKPGRVYYVWEPAILEGLDASGLVLRVIVSVGPDFWFRVTAVVLDPYDVAIAQQIISAIRAVSFE